ncbi:MAG TPA: GNAT family N-acetyltransferase [Candidatus Nanopelagicaceae bacterium]|nr:GNAT family N-acetyltransferase [Candidatus Nanopelagicaceae bacterium]
MVMGFPSSLHQEIDGFVLSDDPTLINADKVHAWISGESYWAAGRTQEVMAKAIAGSHMIGVYQDAEQVAVSRIVSDGATFAWLCDVFVDANFRGKGIGTWMARSAVAWSGAQGITRIVLATRDAHDVYARAGFAPLEGASRWMQIDNRPQRNKVPSDSASIEKHY